MNTVSFNMANYVARQLDYNMPRGWGQGDKATNEHFRPLETFGERFDEMLARIQGLGFEAIDLWLSQLNYPWATPDHIAIAKDLLTKYRFPVVSLVGWFGSTPEEFTATCKIATALGCPILGGSTSVLQKDRDFVVGALRDNGLVLGLENHPEKNPQELLDKIGDPAGGVLGACVDTGWFGTQGYDAAKALEELFPVLVNVHLKDVLAPGAHDTCSYGKGVVPIEGCVRTLKRLGYQGSISIEHEPEHYNPEADCAEGLRLVQGWLA